MCCYDTQGEEHCSLNHVNGSLNHVNGSLNHVNCSLNHATGQSINSSMCCYDTQGEEHDSGNMIEATPVMMTMMTISPFGQLVLWAPSSGV
jgi:hypothetical protein